MYTIPINEKKIFPCVVCGELVIQKVTKRGKLFKATIYQDGHKLTVLSKNGYIIEHRHR